MEAEIIATIEEYANAYCAKDIDRLMALFDDGDDISLIDTGADELCVGADAIRTLFARNFAEATAERFEWHWTQTTVRAASGVAAITLTIHLDIDGQKTAIPIRWTVALHKADGRWRWLHRHASSAAGSQDKGTAYPTE